MLLDHGFSPPSCFFAQVPDQTMFRGINEASATTNVYKSESEYESAKEEAAGVSMTVQMEGRVGMGKMQGSVSPLRLIEFCVRWSWAIPSHHSHDGICHSLVPCPDS